MLLSLDFGLFQIILLNPMSHQFTSMNHTPSVSKRCFTAISEDCPQIIVMSLVNNPQNNSKFNTQNT